MHEVHGGAAANTATAREALRLILWAVLFGAILMLAACGGSDDSPPPAPPPAPTETSATIGAAGGTLDGPDGLRVVIPPNALAQNTVIRIARSAAGAPTAFPDEYALPGVVYELTPHDIAFREPVTISMPAPAGVTDGQVFTASSGDAGWSHVTSMTVGGRVQWNVLSFSWWIGPFACAPRANDPYPCVLARVRALAAATPAAALVETSLPFDFMQGLRQYRLTEATTVNLRAQFEAARDCGDARITVIRSRPGVTDSAGRIIVTTVVDRQPVSLTPSAQSTTRSDGVFDLPVVLAQSDNGVHNFRVAFSCIRGFGAQNRTTDYHWIRVSSEIVPTPAVAPAITRQPANQSVTAPAAATFTAAAGGTPAPTAQWQVSTDAGATWSDIAGATAASYTTPATTTADNGKQYRAVFTNSAASAFSAAAVLTVVASGPRPLAATAIAAGFANALVVATDGTVWAWGYQIDPTTGGYKSTSPWATRPVQVQGLAGVKAVALSSESGSFYALHTDGTVSAWGLNSVGQLGDRTTTTRPLPVKVMQDATTPMDEVCSIAASSNILLMARETGCSPGNRAIAFGPWIAGLFGGQNFGGDGAAGFPSNGAIAKLAPGWPAGQTASIMTAVDAASAGGAVAIRTGRGDGYVWGGNGGNRLGAGVSVTFAGGATGPVLGGWSGLYPLEMGRDFAVAADETGQLNSVGRNVEGQLGDALPSRTTMQPVPGLAAVTAYSAGQVSVAAITGGQLWAWGWNGSGAVTAPTRLGTGTGFTKVSVGDIHSLAIGPGGEVYSWGDGSFGALGDGSSSGSRTVPAVVLRP